MPASHRLIAMAVAVLWGVNFLAIHASLEQFPPMFLVTLRFALIAVPTLVLVPRPAVETRWLVAYGLGFGVLQFLFLYWGMAAGMPTGLASLVLQSSAPFTVLLGVVLFRDVLSARRLLGLALSCLGLAVVGWQQSQSAALLPFLLVLAGGFGWAIGNVANARAQAPNPLHLTLWMSVVPPLPMLALSLVVEGPSRIWSSLDPTAPAMLPALLGLAYTVLLGTVVGSGLWSWLMARHPSGVVAPFSMVVPVVGMSVAWVALGEAVSAGEATGAGMVVAGVLLGSRRPTPRDRARVDLGPPQLEDGSDLRQRENQERTFAGPA
ncbi:EamA family transporter [Nocardioides marmoribigeumensis]|uniref:O-acetylserine/cysteine efflux transporter n=1 Tax=Nocardioides marmoribigeumensis TaxID=433649 RepID=A0ABU2BSX7_9ACTN|nr:EamA family transporter [Nocardioides marmoribigeumensis]MDR7361376.1 O-acetylserine/cysteine efflux transporter [Nocardioides marmoribigeumensis]